MSQLFVTASASHMENQEYSILVSVTESDGKPTQGLKKSNFTVHYLGTGQFANSNMGRAVASVTEGPNGFYSLRLEPIVDYSGVDPSTKRYHRVVAVAVTT